MTRTQIYLSPAQAQGLARVAASTGQSQSQIIRDAVDQYLSRLGPQDKLGRLRAARGIWKNRKISLRDIRSGFERF